MNLNRYAFFASTLLLATAGFLWAKEFGPEPNRSGVTPNRTCVDAGCHEDLPAPNLGGGSVVISGLPSEGWTPGQTYPLMVSVNHQATVYGFQMTAVDSQNTQAGSFVPGSGMSAGFANVGGASVQHLQHLFPSLSSTFSFSWTAPSSAATGNVRFNVAANAANDNRSPTGDFIYTAEQIVSAAEGGGPSLTEAFYFPQIADGGQNTTTIFITNPNVGTTANIQVEFTASDGTPMPVAFLDSSGQSSSGTLSFQLAGGQSEKFVSTSAGASTVSGFAKVSSDIAVTGTAVFSLFSGTPATSTLLGEAGVGASAPTLRQAIFVDESQPFRTALAYANPSDSETANIVFNLLNSEGQSILTTPRTLDPNNHGPLFVDELFPAIPAGHVGTLDVTSDIPIVLVSLRFAGGLFTSVPPFGLQ